MLKSVFATSGTFSVPAKDLKAKITDNGGTVASTLTNSVKYLVTTKSEYNKPSTKVKKALEKDVIIVNEDFIDAAIKNGLKKVDPDEYSFSKTGKKRKRDDDSDEDEDDDEDNDNDNLESYTVPQLKDKCRELGLKVGGKKAELINRIRDHDAEDDEEVVVEKPPKKKKKITIKKKKITIKKKKTTTSSSSKVERNITFGSTETGLFSDVSGNPPRVTTYKVKKNDPKEPELGNVCVVRNVVLQVTDFKTNANKYYSIELHSDEENSLHRIYTHYGRTGDLENNPDAGVKETKYFDNLEDAKKQYNKLYKDKTSAKKGYAPIKLASSNIGSEFVKGMSVGNITSKSGNNANVVAKESKLPEKIQELVRYIYSEATTSLTTQVNVRITAEGISTPLGVLTLEQVEEGEEWLAEIHKYITNTEKPKSSRLEDYSSSFYSKIPHKFGRSASNAKKFIIKDLESYKKKMDLLQLMKDMLKLNSGEEGNVLFIDDIDAKYSALNTEIVALEEDDEEYKKVKKHLIETEYNGFTVTDEDMKDGDPEKEDLDGYNIVNIFKVSKQEEIDRFNKNIGNEHLLYHGSRICNWTGLLSRGILMPENVTKLGIPRTDFGWLGAGIYFGDCSETSLQYCTEGEKGSSFFLLCNAALGKIAKQGKQDGSIREPPEGFDSIHGDPELDDTEFDDNELCIYSDDQQYMAYLVEWEY